MNKKCMVIVILISVLGFAGCNNKESVTEPAMNQIVEDNKQNINNEIDATVDNTVDNENQITSISVSKIENLSDDFIMGVDISSLLSLEASGRVFYGFDGKEQDIFKTLSESGVNYIRVRVWNNPFDENGNGYGGGNCTVDTAIELGKRAAEYDMGLMIDFHYSDFWADPGKQQAPKAWENMSFDEKEDAIYDYTVESLNAIQNNGIKVGMVQIGNETTDGICGEVEKENIYGLMKSAAKAVRDTDKSILIAVHYTNPERKVYDDYANDLINYEVDYDVFATSYYPEYHGTLHNLMEQLAIVHSISGKKVMIAETSWSYDSSIIGAYKRSVQGQADEIYDCINAMSKIGDYAIGVFYWEPAWIDVPGDNESEKNNKRETYGAGWASSYAGVYDPNDAGKYYGGTGCIPTSLFSPEGHPFESLKTFLYVRQGAKCDDINYVNNYSFEDIDYSMWAVTETVLGTVEFQENKSEVKEGNFGIHFWNDKSVEFKVEQTINDLPDDTYTFSLYVQGDGAGEDARLLMYVIADGVRYEQSFSLDGWLNWRVPSVDNIKCSSGSIIIGVEVDAAPGAWGIVDCFELVRQE